MISVSQFFVEKSKGFLFYGLLPLWWNVTAVSFVTDIIDLQLNTNVYQGSKKHKEVIYNDGSNTNDNEFCSVIFAKLLLSFKDFNT